MTFRSSIAGLALAGTAFLWSTTALSQPIAVPVAAAPAAGAVSADPDDGLEAREAGALRTSAPKDTVQDSIPGTLNAQFVAIQANPALAAPEPEPPPPAAAPVEPVTVAALPPVGAHIAAAPCSRPGGRAHTAPRPCRRVSSSPPRLFPRRRRRSRSPTSRLKRPLNRCRKRRPRRRVLRSPCPTGWSNPPRPSSAICSAPRR